jgi:1-acyl-sn-glycerol-3-phosphate acyltransferase
VRWKDARIVLASYRNELRDCLRGDNVFTGPLAARDPEVIASTSRVLGPVANRVFRYELRGLDNIPASPCLLVGNHSGAGVVEVPCILVKWHESFGERRPGYGLTNVLSLGYPVIGGWLRAIGGVDASYDVARACLAAGRDTLVFPGGDIDSFRPFYQTRRVNFGNRRGYIKLALEMKVPIVPLATLGSHLTYWMLPGNAWIAKKLGLKQSSVRLESAPLTFGGVAAVAAMGVAAFGHLHPGFAALAVTCALLPFPSRITTEALPAIDLARELPDSMDPSERVERGHRMVITALEAALQRMDHRTPLA